MFSGSPREKVEGKQEQAEGTSGSGRALRIALPGPEGTSASKNLGGGVSFFCTQSDGLLDAVLLPNEDR